MPNAQHDSNLKLWLQVEKTDPEQTRKVEMRGGFTAIDPTYQLKVATALWGPYGSKWGLRNLEWEMIDGTETIKPTMTIDAEFWYPGGNFPISADMPFKANDDCRKKLLTSARSKALSLLGFSADIFMGKYEDDRYVAEMKATHSDQDELRRTIMVSIRGAKSVEQLEKITSRVEGLFANGASVSKTLQSECLQVAEQIEQHFGSDEPPDEEKDAIRQQELTDMGVTY